MKAFSIVAALATGVQQETETADRELVAQSSGDDPNTESYPSGSW